MKILIWIILCRRIWVEILHIKVKCKNMHSGTLTPVVVWRIRTADSTFFSSTLLQHVGKGRKSCCYRFEDYLTTNLGPDMEHEGCVELQRRNKCDFGRNFGHQDEVHIKWPPITKMTARTSSTRLIWATKSMDLVKESITVLYWKT